jgi:hypothetical protein
MSERCGAITGYEVITDEPVRPVECLRPKGHEGEHADWTAWFGVPDPDFSRPGESLSSDRVDHEIGRLT